ncbi:MAG: ABC transporter ATP-binding protein [Candidatus Puniceispirillales bacterium]
MSNLNIDNQYLKIKNLSYSYEKGKNTTQVLNNISFEIKKGEMVALVGPSGSGKSTLLNLIGLLEQLKLGKIFLNKELINPTSKLIRNNIRLNRIGFVFQFHRLLPEFSARENIAIPQMMTGLTKNLALKRSDELLEMMDLINRKNNRPGELSGGEQQRVAIARSLANAPSILLADEPTGNLDSQTALVVINQLRKIVSQTKLTCLIVTHNIEIANLMDRKLKLDQRSIIE